MGIREEEYLDRDRECDALQCQINSSCRFLWVDSGPHCGASSFFKKFSLLQARSEDGGWYGDVLYIELKDHMVSFEEAMLQSTVLSSKYLEARFRRDIPTIRNGEALPPGTVGVMAAILQGITNIGISILANTLGVDPLTMIISTTINSTGIYSGVFKWVQATCTPAAYKNEVNPYRAYFRDFFDNINCRMTVVIDGAQYLQDGAIDEIIDVLTNNEHICFLLGYTETNNDANIVKAQVKGHSQGLNDINQPAIQVRYPDLDFLTILNNHFSWGKSEGELLDISARASGNIYRLKQMLLSGSKTEEAFDSESKAILLSCYALNEGISRDLLAAFCCEELKISLEVFDEHSKWLETIGYLSEDLDSRLSINSRSDITEVISEADVIAYRSNILCFFCNYQGPIPFRDLEVLIEMAKNVFPGSLQPITPLVRRYAEALLCKGISKLSVNDLEIAFPHYNDESFRNGLPSTIAKNDFTLMLASLFVKQDFNAIIDIVQMNDEACLLDERFELLYGIALNRVRKHGDAHKHLQNVFNSDNSCDLRAIAACYYIVNLIYLNRPDKALEAFESCTQELATSAYYPYVQRNAASLKADKDELVEYLENLHSDGISDSFCLGTIENNLGRAYLAINQPGKAEEMLNNAKDKLAYYQQRNQAIILNNMAILECKRKDFKAALRKIHQAIDFARGEMPANEMQQIFLDITKAAILFRLGSSEYANHIAATEKRALAHSVKHTQEVYYANRALFEVISGTDEAVHYVDKLECHHNVLRPKRTAEIASRLRSALDNQNFNKEELWEACFDPPYLVFWYVNPLSIIEGTISEALQVAC